MKIIITENQFKRLINENLVLYGATFIVNQDGTVTVDVKGTSAKIRFSKFYMDINVASIVETDNLESSSKVEFSLSVPKSYLYPRTCGKVILKFERDSIALTLVGKLPGFTSVPEPLVGINEKGTP